MIEAQCRVYKKHMEQKSNKSSQTDIYTVKTEEYQTLGVYAWDCIKLLEIVE